MLGFVLSWFVSLDTELLRLINPGLRQELLDPWMVLLSGSEFFLPAMMVCAAVILWRGKLRGLVFLLMVGLAVAVGDGLVSHTLKEIIGRPRPMLAVPEVLPLVGAGTHSSMPSSHAVNWFAAVIVSAWYYRRWSWLVLGLAVLVSCSRVYNGAHYPSDVLVGAIVGMGCAGASLWLASFLWTTLARRWFPLWWARAPSLLYLSDTGAADAAEEEPEMPRRPALCAPQLELARSVFRLQPAGDSGTERSAPRPEVSGSVTRPQPVLATVPDPSRHAQAEAQWMRLGYLTIAVLLLLRLIYIAGPALQLTPDEAYQWVWSKHPDLSYYSKPPLIACAQMVGTGLWGNREFGVRFLSPLIAALLGIMVLRFLAREVNARMAFLVVLAVSATPMMSAGAVLMTVDPLSVLFWTATMLAGWRTVRDDVRLEPWIWVGLWTGLGFLSKYTALFQWLCWGVFFWLWPPARKHLRRPGPYVALIIGLICAIPVLVWNARHDWVTVAHVAEDAGAGKAWRPTLKYLAEFLGAEFGLLNPVFLFGAIWAAVAFWRKSRNDARLVYFFSMGAPVFLIYLVHSFRSRVLPNWIAPSVLPLFFLMAIYWDTRWRLGLQAVKAWLGAGLILGALAVVIGHHTELLEKIIQQRLPPGLDPHRRARKWDATGEEVERCRAELLAEGRPVFIIGDHYGITGELSFYILEANQNIKQRPLVFYKRTPRPENQFYFWPGYGDKVGQNAIFVRELNFKRPAPGPAPASIRTEFQSVTDLGMVTILHRDLPIRYLQLYACRGLRSPKRELATERR